MCEPNLFRITLKQECLFNINKCILIQWNLYKEDTIGAWKKCPFYGDICFLEIPCKNEYLAKINQERIFEVNRFYRIKKGHVEWNEKSFYFNNNNSNAITSKQKSKVNNIDILVDWNQLKYDVIGFCFLFWSCKFSNFLVTLDNILWLSSSKEEHLLIFSSIFNDSVKLSVSSLISSTSSSSYVLSSEISWAMLFLFKTALIQTSRDFCRQSILCSLLEAGTLGYRPRNLHTMWLTHRDTTLEQVLRILNPLLWFPLNHHFL